MGACDRCGVLAACGGGGTDAFGVLFERHSRAVCNYLFRRTADWPLAEDLTSIVFLEAWRRRRDVSGSFL